MDFRLLTSPCGRDCFNCPFYQARENPRLAAALADKFGLQFEEAVCEGCRPSKGNCPILDPIGLSKPCSIYACSRSKDVEFCHECGDFPCERLHPVADRADQLPHNLKVYNLCMIKKLGLDRWAEKQAKVSFQKYFQEKLSF